MQASAWQLRSLPLERPFPFASSVFERGAPCEFGRSDRSNRWLDPPPEQPDRYLPKHVAGMNHRQSQIRRLLRRAIVAVSPPAATRLFNSYRPEKHYMRGPGPKSIGMIGERFRAETENITREPVPQRWLELMQSLEQHERHAIGEAWRAGWRAQCKARCLKPTMRAEIARHFCNRSWARWGWPSQFRDDRQLLGTSLEARSSASDACTIMPRINEYLQGGLPGRIA